MPLEIPALLERGPVSKTGFSSIPVTWTVYKILIDRNTCCIVHQSAIFTTADKEK